MEFQSYVDMLLARVQSYPHRTAIHLVSDQGKVEDISNTQLLHTASKYAHQFALAGVRYEERVLLILPTGKGFVSSFYGCYLLGACPVPVYPPFRLYDVDAYINNLANIIQNSRPTIVVGFSLAKEIIQSAINLSKMKIPLLLEEKIEKQDVPYGFEPLLPKSSDLGLIQYTSGSTGKQKGVCLSFHNLLINNKGCKEHCPLDENDVQVSWLPLYHDMGLIASLLLSFYTNYPIVLMSPQHFLRNPLKWIQLFHEYRGTFAMAPNFSYSLCAKRVKDKDIEGLDISRWRIAGCAAEPIDINVLDQFVKKFSKCGFRNVALMPSYGLAESTVATTMATVATDYVIDSVDREYLEEHKIARASDKENAAKIVCLGKTFGDHVIQIVDEEGKPLPDRHEGEITLRGSSLMQGYFEAPELTKSIINDGWLYTGDLGYLTEHGVHITGRKKDIIIKGGRNFYPHLLEAAVEGIDGIRVGCVVAFGAQNNTRGTEDLIILAESRLDVKKHQERLTKKIRESILSAYNCGCDKILILPPGSLHKTSSGKLQRSACKISYNKGFFEKQQAKKKVWLMLLKIVAENKIQAFRGFFQEQQWSKIWQEPFWRSSKTTYSVIDEENAIENPLFDRMKEKEEEFFQGKELQELFLHHQKASSQKIFGYMVDSTSQRRCLQYQDIYTEVIRYAQGLVGHKIRKGDKVLIILPPKRDFIVLFFACTLVGAIPITTQPPFRLYEINSYIDRLIYIIEDSSPKLLIYFSQIREVTRAAILKTPQKIKSIDIDHLPVEKGDNLTFASLSKNDVALIQYTQGTVNSARGVVFTHENLLVGLKSVHELIAPDKNDIIVSWIPINDSSSLVSLYSFFSGVPIVLISPESFLQDPKIWLWAISYYKGTISIGTSSFYEACCLLPEENMESLDLSTWRMALYSGDGDYVASIERFAQRFASNGFSRESLHHFYGTTEMAMFITRSSDDPPSTDKIDYPHLISTHKIQSPQNGAPLLQLTSIGKNIPFHEFRVTNEDRELVPENTIGTIWVKGPALMKKYFDNPTETAIKLQNGWLDTGDCGYIKAEQLYILGRKENLIRTEKQFLYTHLIEKTVEEVSGVISRGAVVFSNPENKIIVLAEIQLGIKRSTYEMTHEIEQKLRFAHKFSPDVIELLPYHSLPRTISGNIQKKTCQEHYNERKLSKKNHRLWLDMLKLYSSNRLYRLQENLKIWQWFRTWREYNKLQQFDAEVIQKQMIEIIANELDISSRQLSPSSHLVRDLGLDSLKAVELVTIMEENLEVSIPDSALEEYPTIAELANYICELKELHEQNLIQSSEIEQTISIPMIHRQESVSELFLLHGNDKEEIKNSLQALQERMIPGIPLSQLSQEWNQEKSAKETLSLVAQSQDDLKEKINVTLEKLSMQGRINLEDPRGIYYFSGPLTSPKIAFLFSGQGSQYLDMGLDLGEKFPVVNQVLRRFDQMFSERHGLTLRQLLSSSDPQNKLHITQAEVAQPAILATSLSLYYILRQLQITPHCVTGHSYGEYTAAFTSGVIEENDLYSLALSIKSMFKNSSDSLGMAAVGASQKKTEDIISLIPGNIFIANKNCSIQTVVAGDTNALRTLINICKCLQISADLLPINEAFHCPMAQGFKNTLSEKLTNMDLQAPLLPWYSSCTTQLVSEDKQEIRSLLADMIVRPVDFKSVIRNMFNDGVNVFIEVGPRNILTSFVKQILKGENIVAVASNDHQTASMSQINHLLGMLAAHNIPFTLPQHSDLDVGVSSLITPLVPATPFVAKSKEPISPEKEREVKEREAERKVIQELPPPDSIQARLLENPLRQQEILGDHISEQVCRTLGADLAYPIDKKTPLQELQLSSLQAIELKTSLEESLKVALPTTIVFDYPTIDAIASYLQREVLASSTATPSTATQETLEEKRPSKTDKNISLSSLSEEELYEALSKEIEDAQRVLEGISNE